MNTGSFVFAVKNNSTLLEQAFCFTPGNRAFHSEVTLHWVRRSLSPDQLQSCQWHRAAFLEFLNPAPQWTTSGSLSWVDSTPCALGVRCPSLPPSLKIDCWVAASAPLRSSTQVKCVCGGQLGLPEMCCAWFRIISLFGVSVSSIQKPDLSVNICLKNVDWIMRTWASD